MVRTNKGRTNKGQITFFRKIKWVLIRDKYLEKFSTKQNIADFFFWLINSHAVGRYSGVPFTLVINYIHLWKLRNRKKSLENFRRFISQERYIRILIWSACCLYFNVFFNYKSCSYSKLWFLLKSLSRKIKKIVINIFKKRNKIMKDICKKPRNKPFSKYKGCII